MKRNHIKNKKTFAIIGYGTIGKVFKSILGELGIDTIICDRNSNNGIESYNDIDIAVCDAVIVATPPQSHVEIAKYFVNKNIPTLVEKPAGINMTDYIELEETIRNGDPLYLAYHTRFNPVIIEAYKHLRKNIKKIEVTYSENVGDYHDLNSWIFNKDVSGGGCVIDSGINIFSVIYELTNNFDLKKVNLSASHSDVEDKAYIMADTDKGIEVIISIDWRSNHEQRQFRFVFEDDSYVLVDIATEEIWKDSVQIKFSTNNKVNHNTEYRNLVKDFIQVIVNNNFAKPNSLLPLKTVLDIYNFDTCNDDN